MNDLHGIHESRYVTTKGQTMKIRIKQNVGGNWIGYQGSQKVIEFKDTPTSTQKEIAEKWLIEQNHKKAVLQKILESAFEKVKR